MKRNKELPAKFSSRYPEQRLKAGIPESTVLEESKSSRVEINNTFVVHESIVTEDLSELDRMIRED